MFLESYQVPRILWGFDGALLFTPSRRSGPSLSRRWGRFLANNAELHSALERDRDGLL